MTATLRAAATGLRAAATALLSPLVALILSGLLLLLLGYDPGQFLADVIRHGILGVSWQQSLVAATPLLLIGAALIVAFRARLWNLGTDGQFLLGAVVSAGCGPALFAALPAAVATVLLTVLAMLAGALWALVPAWLRARTGTNEVITTLMMSFLAVNVVNLLIKHVFADPSVNTPQTPVLALANLLPYLPGTRVQAGLIVALLVPVGLHLLIHRSALGLRVDVYGGNPRAARHAGIAPGILIIGVLLASGALAGLAAALDTLGQWGYLRANWNPGYGALVMPFVFLARLQPLRMVPGVVAFAVLLTGGRVAAAQQGVSSDVLLVLVAALLLCMLLVEYVVVRAATRRGSPARTPRIEAT